MRTRLILVFLVSILAGAGFYASAGLDDLWIDQFNQKSIKPFETGSFRELPEGSVTTDGFENTTEQDWFSWTSEQDLDNPDFGDIAVIKLNSELGQKLYNAYCLVCHGDNRNLNKSGLAATKINELGMLAPALPFLTPSFADPYLYLKIENGGTVMPRLGHIVIEKDRWQIIGYLRKLEGETKSP